MAVALLVWSATVAWFDWRTRRISNTLLLVIAVPAIVLLAWRVEGPLGASPLSSLLGAVLAAALFLPGFVMKRCGGGDLKFAACCGGLLGLPDALIMMLVSSLLLGFSSICVLLWRRAHESRSARFAAGPAIATAFVTAMIFARVGN